MTREEALKEADAILENLLASGDEQIFEAARGADGRIDQMQLVMAAMYAREHLADGLMQDAVDKALE